jgi:hypothetical protein
VDWGSAWWAALILAATWAGITLFAERTVGLATPRPPAPGIVYGPEPRRDTRGLLDGFGERSAEPASDASR